MSDESTRLVSAVGSEDDRLFETGLRPTRLSEFTGQTRLKENLQIAIDAARKRGERDGWITTENAEITEGKTGWRGLARLRSEL